MSETGKDVDEIHQIIDSMQARLVELFDQLRALRVRLDQRVLPEDDGTILPLFSKIEEPTKLVDAAASIQTPSPKKRTKTAETKSGEDTTELPVDESDATSAEPEQVIAPDAKVSRLLDPITHELKTGDSPAEVIAEYVQSAKDELITEKKPNDKVARDMDIVLKFLRARGRRGIRPEERDNILRRIKRWQAHLGK
ncbi:MAG: hypothetical protein ACFFDM_00145 [Candidatus Thorarchaeota archaeon]